ncbi:Sec7 domain containing protein [Trichomonas vaginalis G3]|uniref:Sec7 domain containing protein n=1 Tax=Trichomonas vaginalis (strain ATCC PRA-98 / G3) TaxID=412133 RepID=A2EX17_TRIV3|nr:regulation of ARF protein signal transduction [Trichomonas vaginalis G3]EAY02794.1 Sec7 domain containing protein [Trichomonas vaginalis G3]KAI5537561.1 regulation of ARF protein signal transduction [Trichomonas vaginalis G3]|eukprot:XP_001315017.1 Sec7 domain containing protein [Trichomonas vaginalis G3]
MMELPFILLDTFSTFIIYVFEKQDNSFDSLRKEAILSIFYIATSFQSDHHPVARFAAMSILLSISRSNVYGDKTFLIAASCVLLNQQIALSNSRECFMLSMRIFFNIFKDNCFELFSLFSPCFSLILNYILSPEPNILFRSSAFETVYDFISQPMFTQKLFANTDKIENCPRLFDKLLEVVVLIAKTPSGIPDSQQMALNVISVITHQLSTITGRFDEADIIDDNETEKVYNEFTVEFNQKFKKFIEFGDAKELAKRLFVCDGVTPNNIGEFFALKNDFAIETLKYYLDLFKFETMDFDESIRTFLVSFKLAGEGQIVDRILDNFSQKYHLCHPGEFKSASAIHLLAYAWVMLQTSMFNRNATKDSFDQFRSMLSGQNDGGNFDEEFLKQIYQSVSRFSVPAEQEHKINCLSYWHLLLLKSQAYSKPLKCENEVISKTKSLFARMWTSISPILSASFLQAQSNFDDILSPFFGTARIASLIEATDVLDSIMKTFCSYAIGDFAQEKTQCALKFVSVVAREFGTGIREIGWKNYADVLVALFQLDLLCEEICAETNVCDGNKQMILSPRMQQRSERRNSSSVMTMFRRIGRSDSDSEINLGGSQQIKIFIFETGIHSIAKQSLRFSYKSLQDLIKAFSETSKAMENNVDTNCVFIAFCVHVVCQISASNSQRIQSLWESVYGYIKNVFILSMTTKSGKLLSSLSLNSLFVLFDELWCEDCMKETIIDSLINLSKFDSAFIKPNIDIINSGLSLFLQHHASTFIPIYNWTPILNFISIGVDCRVENGVGYLFHSIIAKQNFSAPGVPGVDKFIEFWMPVLQIAALLCISDNEQNYVERFRDFQSLLLFQSMPNLDGSRWRDVFEKILFPVMGQLTMLAMKKSESGQKALLMAKLIMSTFLFALNNLIGTSAFESTWYRILKFSLDLTKIRDDDVIEAVPEMLSNALRVMKASGIFDGDQRKSMWDVTKNAITSSFPDFSSSILDDD